MTEKGGSMEKSTDELKGILTHTHMQDMQAFFSQYENQMMEEGRSFSDYMRRILKEKKLRQQDVFLQADIPERYGYKLLSGERRTRQRDVILRICYAAEMSLEETQKALRLYRLPELYAKEPRDAALIVVFSTRPGSIIEVNTILRRSRMEPLRPCGMQD